MQNSTNGARRRRLVTAVVGLGALFTLTACSTIGDPGTSSDDQASGGTVVLVTHDSFAVSKKLIAEFEAESGLDIQTRAPGDAGTLVNQLVLSKDAPLGDAVFGIDNTFSTRALDAGVLRPYESRQLPQSAEQFAVDDTHRLTPIDYGDVCMNVDQEWFAKEGVVEPRTLEDLADPTYKDLTVVENPATSSPGLAFLLTTISAFGEDGWQDYWTKLGDNGVKVSDSWSDAYFVDFSGSSGHGPRPIVLSYASSPPAEVKADAMTAPTKALLDTCFRQVEYAGVLEGAQNPEGAQELIDFMLSNQFQEMIPGKMYMYPIDQRASLPSTWAKFGPLADQPFTVSPDQIDANRETWIQQWTDVVIG